MSVAKGVQHTAQFPFKDLNQSLLSAKILTAYISKDSATYTISTNPVVEIGYGEYKLILTATEMNADLISLHVTDGIVSTKVYIQTEVPTATIYADTTEILTRLPDATAGGVGGLAIVGSEMGISSSGLISLDSKLSTMHGSGVWTSTNISVDNNAIATSVWSASGRTLSSFGTLVSDIASAVWSATTRTLSVFGFNVTVDTNNDKTGYGLSSNYDAAKNAASQNSVDGIQNTVDGISNVTRISTSLPQYISIPEVEKYILIETAYKNSSGTMDDPDNNKLLISIYAADGSPVYDTYLYSDYLGENQLTLDEISGMRVLSRDSQGLYHCYMKIENTFVEEEITVKFMWLENNENQYEFRGSQIANFNGDLGLIYQTVSELPDSVSDEVETRKLTLIDDYNAAKTAAQEGDEMVASNMVDISGLSTFNPISDIISRVTLVDTVTTNTDMRGTDNAITSLNGIATEANATLNKETIINTMPDISTIETDITSIKDKTTNLPSDPASESLIEAAISAATPDIDLSEITNAISGLNDFDPINDTVAHVTLVDTTTTNTDMRGTDHAIISLATVAKETQAWSNYQSLYNLINNNTSSLPTIVDSLDDLVLIKKILMNKTEDDGSTITVYDDDGETILGTFSWHENTGTRDAFLS